MELFEVYPLFDVEPVRGSGSYVFDKSGQAYLDFYGGHAVISIGHSHPHYVQSIKEQLDRLAFYSNSIINSLQTELATKMGKVSGYDDYQLFLCNTGAEANENALKLASFLNGRKKCISFRKSFHGRTSAVVNVTDNTKIKAPINALFDVEYVEESERNRIEALLAKEDICAVIIEPIQGIGGIHVFESSFLKWLHECCEQHNTYLVADEVQCGYGRSGQFFAHQAAHIRPPLITTAKGMGNGFPIGGVLIHPNIKPSYGLLGTTFGGNHLACAAGLAVLEVIEKENLMHNAMAMGQLLQQSISAQGIDCIIRGSGLMIGLEFAFPVREMRKQLIFKHHIFTGSSSNPNVLRLLPPLNIGTDEVGKFMKGLSSVLENKH